MLFDLHCWCFVDDFSRADPHPVLQTLSQKSPPARKKSTPRLLKWEIPNEMDTDLAQLLWEWMFNPAELQQYLKKLGVNCVEVLWRVLGRVKGSLCKHNTGG
jgi:hypothetical protein